jgi:D-inositol-3-phosphate glycosyltransferase
VTVTPLHRAARMPRRVAMLSLHTSPLEQPGTGDAGGMNVYVLQLAHHLAARGVKVEVFTRALGEDEPVVEVTPGVRVHHVEAGPWAGLTKEELPAQLCSLTHGVLAAEARHPEGWFDLVHSHYWLSGQVGRVAADRWGVPHVHSAHTLAKVKNARLADGDLPEPRTRMMGEEQVVAHADRLIAATPDEARDLVERYAADVRRIVTVAPGVDLEVFRPGEASTARTHLGVAPDALVLAFAGRLQRLKAPDVLLRAAAELSARDPGLARRLVVLVAGGTSGPDDALGSLRLLADELGIADRVRFMPALPQEELATVFRAADLVAVPSHHESFGLVALEAQACGTPVIATRVGGLTTTVADGVSGLLVDGHDPLEWAGVIDKALGQRDDLASRAREHAMRFSWGRTADGVLSAYVETLATGLSLVSSA